MATRQSDGTPEIEAISAVHAAIKNLDAAAQLRVLRYCADMLGLALDLSQPKYSDITDGRRAEDKPPPVVKSAPDAADDIEDDSDGINSIALKWIRRSGLTTVGLQSLFSLGIDEIDLVARSVPGKSKRERMHNVLLLKAVAAYLSTGAPRVTYEQLKEACLHYDAYDATNFSKHIRSFSGDAGGTKEAGFTLTARGLTAATELLKSMLGSKE